MIEYKSDGLVVFVTSVGGGGSGEGGGSGGQMHPESLEKLFTREDELEAENARLREALKECSADFVTKSSDHRIAAQEILNEFERRALVARAALKEKE